MDSETAHDTKDQLNRWVTFYLEKEKYCVDVMQVQEVLRMTEVAPVPGAPLYVLGIINLRGNVVTVVDTRKRFGLMEKEFDDDTRIIIVEANGNVLGMLVDSVAEVVDLGKSDIESTPSVGSRETSRYIHGVATHQGELLIVIDLKKFLSEDELNGAMGF